MPSESELKNFTVLSGVNEYSVRELTAAAAGLDPTRNCLIAIYVPDGPLTAAAALWVRRQALNAVLIHAEAPKSEAETLARSMGCSHLLTGSVEGRKLHFKLEGYPTYQRKRRPAPGCVTLLTSGTSGEPKRVTHNWESLTSSVAQRTELQGARWMSLYPLTRFAGFNTLLHAIYNDAILIVPASRRTSSILEDITRTRPTHVAGTPTLWRNLLMALPADSGTLKSLRQITLGGEVVDQQVLNALASAAPHARLTHIYASTELGVCVAVSDGLAGFPLHWLDNADKAVQLTIRRGELWVRQKKAFSSSSITGEDRWVATRDRVEVRDGRVFIRGRLTDILNVGGGKVLPAEVEERLLEVPGVMAARVTGRRNSVSGMVVAAEIVSASGMSEQALRAALVAHCRACLPVFAVPRIIAFVDSLPATASGKTPRLCRVNA